MEVAQVLHMNGGIGDTSYANNSLVQRKVISITKTITEEAMPDLYSTTLPKSLAIADLGCSSGRNTLLVIHELMNVIDRKRRQLGRPSPEFLVFLNDLPGNDFNTLFKSLPDFHEKLRKKKGDDSGPCFITGVPGSFYGRLFPRESLHFVHASYSLQWLSQGLIEEKKVDTFNLPQYTPSPAEINSVVQREGSFGIDRLEISEVNWNTEDCNGGEGFPLDKFTRGHNVAKYMRAVAEPLLATHFGEALMDELFRRYGEIVANRMSKEQTKFTNVVVSMSRRR